ncbi:amino acid adenylation domain-containing protein [Streptomyces hainanensis]|nr:amino acid adenylation domain-containing protein [Streptomyces hainanensis]
MPAESQVPATIPARFTAQVRLRPDAVAVVCGDTELRYAELDERADRMARLLRRLGVGHESRVAVLQERSADLVVSLLAIAKAGAAYVPLHTGYPPARMAWVMRDTGAEVLLTDRASHVFRFDHRARVLTVDEPGTEDDGPWREVRGNAPPEEDPPGPAHPLSLAYIMHTSGSTGQPKGVAVSHQGVADLAADECWGAAARAVLLHAPYAFDISTYELWVPLLNGGRVVLAPPGALVADELRDMVAAHGLTAVHLTAGLFGAMAEESPGAFAGLVELLTGGDVVSPRGVRRVLEQCPGIAVRHLYGPTEVTLFATHCLIREPPSAERLPLGEARSAMRVRLLDDGLSPVVEGGTGELYVAGSGLARGYLDRPEASATRFVPDPFGPPGTRMFRTGDMARLRPGGALEFVGRRDDQVKISGFRVELGEVEAAVSGHPGVNQVAVVARTDTFGDRRLVAYVAGREPDSLTRSVPEHLAGVLPAYMVPTTVVALPALPLTPNGKVDRDALPAPELALDGRRVRSPREKLLCEVFAALLWVDEVAPDDDFFDLGGHSMLAVQLLRRLRELPGGALTLHDVFRSPTPRGLAKRMGREGERGLTDVLLALRTTGAELPLFCVHPILGLSWSYTALLPHLGGEQPLYGLQATGAAPAATPLGSLDDLAQEYLTRIRLVQPTGPYRLMGWSLGGLIAHAMATTLQERGEEVSVLALIDAYPRRPGPDAGVAPHENREVLDALLSSVDPSGGRTARAVTAGRAEVVAAVSEATGLADAGALVDAALRNSRLANGFSPRKFQGDLLFFSASTDRPSGLTAELWERAVTGRVVEQQVAADHYSIMRPAAAREVGRVLSLWLRGEHPDGPRPITPE